MGRVIALEKAEVADVVLALRDVWMPELGVPATIFPDNGSLFTASVVQHFCEGVGVRKNI